LDTYELKSLSAVLTVSVLASACTLPAQQAIRPQVRADGSLTLYLGPVKPKDAPEQNWLPTPKGQNYNLTFRFYGPTGDVAAKTCFPPQLVKQ